MEIQGVMGAWPAHVRVTAADIPAYSASSPTGRAARRGRTATRRQPARTADAGEPP